MLRRRALLYNRGLLPIGYTQLSYVENISNSTILDSGIKPRAYANFKVLSKLSQTSTANSFVGENNGYWFGVNNNRWTIGASIFVGKRTGNVQTLEFTSVRQTSSAQTGQMQLSVDGVLSATRTFSPYNSSNGNFYLVNINSYTATAIIGKIESFEIYGENDLVAKFIPAKRDSDNKVGFFDIVNNTFKAPSRGILIEGESVN